MTGHLSHFFQNSYRLPGWQTTLSLRKQGRALPAHSRLRARRSLEAKSTALDATPLCRLASATRATPSFLRPNAHCVPLWIHQKTKSGDCVPNKQSSFVYLLASDTSVAGPPRAHGGVMRGGAVHATATPSAFARGCRRERQRRPRWRQ
jgi:hypothetical protein